MCGDVGYSASLLAGTQMYDNGKWLLQAAGADIAHIADQFHAVWQKLTNNGSVSARVTSITKLDNYSKGGVMLREGLDPGSRFYGIFTTPDQGLVLEYREIQGGNAALIDIPLSDQTKIPVYLKVTREDNLFNAYYSQDGVNWTVVEGQQKTIPMPATLFAGIALTSHSQTNIGTGTFDSVNVGP
jgi:hypothetical protein